MTKTINDALANELPDEKEIEAENRMATRVSGAISINRLAMLEPQVVQQVIQNRIKALENTRMAAIRATHPQDWVLNRTREGKMTGLLKKSGCVNVRKYYGISTIRIRPDDVVIKHDSEGGITAEIWGDGVCALTGEEIVNVRGARSQGEQFTGRRPEDGHSKTVAMSDLKEAARTNLENKITRILSGMTSIPEYELRAAWAGTNKTVDDCGKGHGFGKGKDREQAQTGSGSQGTDESVLAELIDKIMKVTGKTFEDILVEGTKYKSKKNSKWYAHKTMSAMNQGWMFSNAVDKLNDLYKNELSKLEGDKDDKKEDAESEEETA